MFIFAGRMNVVVDEVNGVDVSDVDDDEDDEDETALVPNENSCVFELLFNVVRDVLLHNVALGSNDDPIEIFDVGVVQRIRLPIL